MVAEIHSTSARRLALAGSRLPVPLTELLSRDDEVANVAGLLQHSRLVTITGPGGVGKTRVAIAVAHRAAQSFTDGVHWVDLAPVTDAPGVGTAVAEALGIAGRSTQGSTFELIQQLQGRAALLILDNCEQLIDASAQLCAELLAQCAGLTVLATSRERLGLPGERTRAVSPLRVPRSGLHPTPGNLQQAGAPNLFVARCRDLVGDFELTPDNAAAVLRICRRVDGIPLAIELAAARVRVLGPSQLADALDRSPDLLGDDARRGPGRHRTLRATLEWSHDLLSSREQQLFRRISIFPGRFDLAAAAAVVGFSADEVVGLLGRLVDKSLVQVSRRQDVARYRLLSTVRDYGRRKLVESEELEATGLAHLAHFTCLAEQSEPRLTGEDGPAELARLELEGSNLRAALAFARAHGEYPLGVRLAAALWPLCYLRGLYREGRQWLDWAVEVGGEAPVDVLAKALRGSGTLAFLQCDYEAAVRRLDAGLQRYRQLDDEQGVAEVLLTLGSVAREQGRYADAQQLYAESRRLAAQEKDAREVARSDNYLGFVAWLQGDLDGADELCASTVPVFQSLGDNEGLAWSLLSRGVVARYRADLGSATRLLAECHHLSRKIGYREGVAWSQHQLGVVAWRQGRRDEARDRLLEALEGHRELGDRWRTAAVLEDLSAMLAEAEPERAAALLGYATALREDIGAPVAPVERDDVVTTTATLTRLLDDRLATAAEAGRGRRLEQLLDDLFNPLPGPAPEQHALGAEEVGEPREITGIDRPRLQIQALGSSRVLLDGHDLPSSEWWYAKPRELLFLLADGTPRTKEELGQLLWPEASPHRLRNALHTALRDLRRALGEPEWLMYARGAYRFDAGGQCRYDVADFVDELKSARNSKGEAQRHHLQRATDLYAGDFLSGNSAAWVLSRRDELAARNRAALLALGRLLVEAHAPREAVPVYRRAIECDPFNENAYRGLMTVLGQAGERTRVAQLYQELAERLDTELGVAPASATIALYRDITSNPRGTH
jgi:predicted ATPase/DNA-binding SARP family transcriptional activator